jgi:hypothetical protein
MATLLSTIETEVAALIPKTRFEYAANLNEANNTIFDVIPNGEFPVCLVLQIDPSQKSREYGRIIMEAELTVFFLDKIAAASPDQSAIEAHPIVLAMRSLSDQFINRMDKTDIIEELGIESVSNTSTYEAIMDAHLYGNMATFTITYSEDLTTCIT